MAKQNILQEVQASIKEMQDKKQADLDKIAEKKEEARQQIEAAAQAMNAATEQMDVDAYEEAKTAKRKAQTALDMYNGRYAQILGQEYISEAESDKVIDSLLAYDREVVAGFEKDLAEHLLAIKSLLDSFNAEEARTLNTITLWQESIHKNYRTLGRTLYTDPETGKQTARSKNPVNIMQYAQMGSTAVNCVRDFLKLSTIEQLIKGE